MKKTIVVLMAIMAVLISAGATYAWNVGDVLGDRLADWSNTTQGANNWYYRYWVRDPAVAGYPYDPNATSVMQPRSDGLFWEVVPRLPGDKYAMMWGTPTGYFGAMQSAGDFGTTPYPVPVHRWRNLTSGYAGAVRITGHVAEIDQGVPADAHVNGEYLRVYVDGVLAGETLIAPNDFAGHDYSFMATIAVGSRVDFLMEPVGPEQPLPGEEAGWLMPRVSGQIQVIPEPSSLMAIGFGLTSLAGIAIRRRR